MPSYADLNETSTSLGAANCETVAKFVGSWEAQRSRVVRKSERSLAVPGAGTAKPSQVSVTPGRPSITVPHADQNEASPSLGAANCAAVASFGGSWEAQRRGATRGSE